MNTFRAVHHQTFRVFNTSIVNPNHAPPRRVGPPTNHPTVTNMANAIQGDDQSMTCGPVAFLRTSTSPKTVKYTSSHPSSTTRPMAATASNSRPNLSVNEVLLLSQPAQLSAVGGGTIDSPADAVGSNRIAEELNAKTTDRKTNANLEQVVVSAST